MRKFFLPVGIYLVFAGLMINSAQAQFRFGPSTIMPYGSGEPKEPLSSSSFIEREWEIEQTDISGYGFNLVFPAGFMLRLDMISSYNIFKNKDSSAEYDYAGYSRLNVEDELIFSVGYRQDDYPYHIALTVGFGSVKVELDDVFENQSISEDASLLHFQGGYALAPNFDVYFGMSLITIAGELPAIKDESVFFNPNSFSIDQSEIDYDIGGRFFSIGVNFARQ